MKIQIEQKLAEDIINYLKTRPWVEVNDMMVKLLIRVQEANNNDTLGDKQDGKGS